MDFHISIKPATALFDSENVCNAKKQKNIENTWKEREGIPEEP